MTLNITIKAGGSIIAREVHFTGRLDELLLELGYLIDRQCAGAGRCGRCVVKVSGALGEPTEAEVKHLGSGKLEEGYRLACQVDIRDDVEVELPDESPHTDKIFGEFISAERLPDRIGLAVDLGTTTVGVFLLDMDTGRVLAANAVINRQSSLGADVISRLESASKDPEPLRKLAVDSIMDALGGLMDMDTAAPRVEKCVIVGNTAMHHLLLGLDIGRLLVTPFHPTVEKPLLHNPFPGVMKDVPVWLPGLIGGFVGSDALACALYFGLGKNIGLVSMVVDLGTNGEVLLDAGGDRLLASSTAAGPAFEGVNISCGMRAARGAVISSEWDGDVLALETIGAAPAAGLAGSGLLSVIRNLRDRGIIEVSGRMIDPEKDTMGLTVHDDGGKAVRLGAGLSLTQLDVRELQKAKGAVRACADILLEMTGIEPRDIDRLYLTGSFGGRIDVKDALELGVLPRIGAERILSIPNGAGLGAALMLDDDELYRANELARSIEHVELFSAPEFMDKYIASMSLE